MSEMPFHLKTLPPEALAILRYFKTSGTNTAQADALAEETGLSERSYGKAIRRLVTKGYLTMDGNGRYRLTEFGQRAVVDYADSDDDVSSSAPQEETFVERRLVLALPAPLVAGEPAAILIGIDEAQDEEGHAGPQEILVRLSAVHGDPSGDRELTFRLDEGYSRQQVEITPGRYRRMRLRVRAFQLGDDEAFPCGGMYVDADVVASRGDAQPQYRAYAGDLRLAVNA